MIFRKKLSIFTVLGTLLFFSSSMNSEVEATAEEALDDERAEENLELPDIYENTIIYNGTVNPELLLRIYSPEFEVGQAESIEDDESDDPYVNENGQFSTTFLSTLNLQAGDEVMFGLHITDEPFEPNLRTIEVLPAEEGMGIVESSADTSEVQNSVREASHFDWRELEGEQIILDLEAVGDIESEPYFSINNEPISDEHRMEINQDNFFWTLFTPDQLNIGDIITVYVIASGVTTPVEVEVPDTLTSLQDTSEEQPVESEEPDDNTADEDPEGEAEDQNNGEDDESDIDDEENLDEVDPPETEGAEDETEGLSTGWIIAGVILGLAVIGGIVFAIMKGKQ